MSLVKCEKLENSAVELQFSVAAEDFKAAVDKVAKRISIGSFFPTTRVKLY